MGEGWKEEDKERLKNLAEAHSTSVVEQGFELGLSHARAQTLNPSCTLSLPLAYPDSCEMVVSKNREHYQNLLFHARHKDCLSLEGTSPLETYI